MNPVTSFLAIFSLWLMLAATGAATKKQVDPNSTPERGSTPSKIVLNHNETLLSDAMSVQQSGALLASGLTSLQDFFFATFSTYKPGGCEEWGCGTNHNETMTRDAAL